MSPYTHILHLVIILFLLLMNGNNEIIICYSNKVIMTAPSIIIIVDKNPGSGNFTSIQAAIDSLPLVNQDRVLIDVHAGIYTEKVTIPSTKAYIKIQGAGAENTVVQWGDTASTQPLGTYGSATFGIDAPYFVAKNITFKNTAPIPPEGADGMQGVALRISGDASAFAGCKFLGAQDTLYDHRGRHYYEDCYIEGSVDFIFGDGRSYFKGCELHAIATGAVTAQNRSSSSENTGFSLVNCRVTGSNIVYLGRAWAPFSTTIFVYTYMENNINPEGWFDWGDPSRQLTVTFGEYQCSGPGSNTAGRVKWSKILTDEEAGRFTSLDFIDASEWLDLS
ncbi:hypothetical protein ACP275_10G106900 [Erythranthe tilingii]